MSWFSNLFTRRVVLVAPEVEQVRKDLEEAEGKLGAAVAEYKRVSDALAGEYETLAETRAQVARVREELEKVKAMPTYQALIDISNAQTTANRAMQEVVQKYARQVQDTRLRSRNEFDGHTTEVKVHG